MNKPAALLLLPDRYLPQHRMTNVELKGLRWLFQLDVKEVVDLAGCAVPSWYAWENGTNPVPERICVLMRNILAQYRTTPAEITELVQRQKAKSPCPLRYYQTFALFFRDNPERSLLDWRLTQAVMGRLMIDGLVSLVSAEQIDSQD